MVRTLLGIEIRMAPHLFFSLFGVVSCTCLTCLIMLMSCKWSKVMYWGKSPKSTHTHTRTHIHTQFMPDINWAQNIGSALILCLSTISVILQPLLSKFSFLINLVSRNGSFCFSPPLHDLRFLTNLPAFQLSSTWSSPLSPSFCFLISVPTACHISKFTSVLSAFLQRWWNGFHQLTTCLDHNVASLWQRHLVYFSCPHSLLFFFFSFGSH